MTRVVKVMAPALVAVLFLLGWHLWVEWQQIPVYLVPGPAKVWDTLVADWGLLSASLLNTAKIAATALGCALLLGVTCAFVFVQSRWIEASLFPYAILLQVTPIVAIAPLIIIWVKDTFIALVVCATIVALFPIIANTTLGLRSVDPGLRDMFRLYRANRWQTLARLRIPSALPYFFAGLRVSTGLALIGAVVAEFVAGTGGTSSGLAYQILMAGLQLNIPRLFAALALIALTGVVLFAAVSLLSRWVLGRWHESEIKHWD